MNIVVRAIQVTVLGTTLFCVGCATFNEAPVDDRSSDSLVASRPPQVAIAEVHDAAAPTLPPQYTVVAGDTVYGIAFRNGLDYRALAAWNGIDPPYTIRLGQALSLAPPERPVSLPIERGDEPVVVAGEDRSGVDFSEVARGNDAGAAVADRSSRSGAPVDFSEVARGNDAGVPVDDRSSSLRESAPVDFSDVATGGQQSLPSNPAQTLNAAGNAETGVFAAPDRSVAAPAESLGPSTDPVPRATSRPSATTMPAASPAQSAPRPHAPAPSAASRPGPAASIGPLSDAVGATAAAPARPQPKPAAMPTPATTSPKPPAVAIAAPVAVASAASKAPVAVISTGATQKTAGIVWRWPARGALAGRFVNGDPARQGVEIKVASGQPVVAAADGEVVYSGNGLIGYGELIIVKHTSEFLSAYGRSTRRMVKEGDKIKAGQPIAEVGSNAAGTDMLHFEIRRSGKPVDPQQFLPNR